MDFPRLVIPRSAELLQSFTGHWVTVRVEDPAQAAAAAAEVQESGNRLFCVMVDSGSSLEDIELPQDLNDIPMALMLPSAGMLRNYTKLLKQLREFNIRIHLPCTGPENLTSLRILSSLGVHTCAMFGRIGSMGGEDWEGLADLMTYALLEPSSHAPMEPFAFMAEHHDRACGMAWGAALFDDPSRFLHLDTSGRVALSQAELQGGRFIAQDISEIAKLDDPGEFPPIRERVEAWRWYFAQNHPCASCGGWALCRGRFSDAVPEDKGCEAFFKDLQDAVPRSRNRTPQPEEHVWQP